MTESSDHTLARELDRIQTDRNTRWRQLGQRVEWAQAAQNRASCMALARLDPAVGAAVLEVRGGVALYMGKGSPLTQALAMGFEGPLEEAEIDAIEQHLGRGGGGVQFELCPAPVTDPALYAALARRGYQVQELQLAWVCTLADPPPALEPPPGVVVSRLDSSDTAAVMRVILAGFLETTPARVPAEAMALLEPTAHTQGVRLYGAFVDGTLMGGATLYVHEGVGVLSGSGVAPAGRRRGAQGALIRARLHEAYTQGCALAASTTAPGSSSQRNMERHGFRVAYPKVVLLRP